MGRRIRRYRSRLLRREDGGLIENRKKKKNTQSHFPPRCLSLPQSSHVIIATPTHTPSLSVPPWEVLLYGNSTALAETHASNRKKCVLRTFVLTGTCVRCACTHARTHESDSRSGARAESSDQVTARFHTLSQAGAEGGKSITRFRGAEPRGEK